MTYLLRVVACLLVVFFLVACTEPVATLPATILAPTPTVVVRRPTDTPLIVSTPTPVSPCPLPDLLVGQHISASASYTETETTAAGPMVCRIEPDSCAYYYLVGNLEPSIVFKREEEPPYDEEDILMHPDMLLPLTRLNKLVLAEWQGAFWLRITDAYDSRLEHDLGQTNGDQKISLHFEGRSIDMTTWPIDTSRYGRLCALAHCAGFDWVHDEGDHCHASIRAESLCLRCGGDSAP
jgi:hypothetical protein